MATSVLTRVAAQRHAGDAIEQCVLDELETLERMVRSGQFTDDRVELGFEAEFGFVDKDGQPARANPHVIPRVPDSQPELSLASIELNPGPQPIGPGALSWVESYLSQALDRLAEAAAEVDAFPFATGTIFGATPEQHICTSWLSAKQRYNHLDRACVAARGGRIDVRIAGREEFCHSSETVMGEGYMFSLQPHLKLPVDQFGRAYNFSLAIAAPLARIAWNSPLAFRRVLHPETRDALWKEVIHFGKFGNDAYLPEGTPDAVICYFLGILAGPTFLPYPGRNGDTHEDLHLRNLALHNSIRWRYSTRPVYGWSPENGPHVRLENRQLPMSPPRESAANVGAFIGLVTGCMERYDSAADVCPYEQAEAGFHDCVTRWDDPSCYWDGRTYSAAEWWTRFGFDLVELGLQRLGVSGREVEMTLTTLSHRLNGNTGAERLVGYWDSVSGSTDRKVAEASRFVVRNQKLPFSEWV